MTTQYVNNPYHATVLQYIEKQLENKSFCPEAEEVEPNVI